MKNRISIWATVGFLVACCWIIYTFVTPPELLGESLRKPLVEALVFLSCPISLAGRYFPVAFWWLPPVNAVTYAIAGLLLGVVARRRELGSPK